MNELIEQLHAGGFSCVIDHAGEVRTFTRRGVGDLYLLYTHERAFLQGSSLADKVVGRAAAALILLGEMKEVYADVISTPALQMLREHGIHTTFGHEVPFIQNRSGDGCCPLESMCAQATTPAGILPLITQFISQRKQASVPPENTSH